SSGFSMRSVIWIPSLASGTGVCDRPLERLGQPTLVTERPCGAVNNIVNPPAPIRGHKHQRVGPTDRLSSLRSWVINQSDPAHRLAVLGRTGIHLERRRSLEIRSHEIAFNQGR